MILDRNFNYTLFHDLFNHASSPAIERKLKAVINNTITLISEHGIDGVTLTQIARKSTISPSALKYHFKSEKELKIRCIKYIRLQYQQYVIDQVVCKKTPRAKIAAYFKGSIDWPRANPAAFKFWMSFFHKASTDTEYKTLSNEMVQVGRERFKVLLTECLAGTVVSDEIVEDYHNRLTLQVLRQSFEHITTESDTLFVEKTTDELIRISGK